MQPGWCQPVRQEFMENECEALPGVAYPGVRDNRSTLNTKTGHDDDDDYYICLSLCQLAAIHWGFTFSAHIMTREGEGATLPFAHRDPIFRLDHRGCRTAKI